MFRGFLENIALCTQADFQRHDDGFTQRVNRRVSHLRKLLAEVVVRRAHALGQHGHGRVIAHGADRFVALLAQWAQYLIALFERDLIHLHVLLELIDVVKRRTVVVVIDGGLNAQRILAQPLLIRMARLQAVVDGVGVQHLTGFGVDSQNLARPYAAFGNHVFGLVVPHADFRGDGDVAVGGRDPARWAQAVAVEQANGIAAICHDDARRAVPRLHVHGVVLIKRPQVGVHGFNVLPGRWNQHAHATEQVDAAGDHQLQHVVHA